MEEEIELGVNDKVVDTAIKKLEKYNQLVKKTSQNVRQAAKNGGMGPVNAGGMPGGLGFQDYLAQSGAVTSSVRSNQQRLGVGKGKPEQNIKWIISHKYDNQFTDKKFKKPLRMRRAEAVKAAAGKAGILATNASQFAEARGTQFAEAMGRGAIDPKSLGKSAVSGGSMRIGMMLGRLGWAAGPVGGIVGALIGATLDNVLSKVFEGVGGAINKTLEGGRRRKDIIGRPGYRNNSQYIKSFTAQQIVKYRKSRSAMRKRLDRDRVTKYGEWKFALGFIPYDYVWRDDTSFFNVAREELETRYKEITQGIGSQRLAGSDMQAQRLAQTYAWMMRP